MSAGCIVAGILQSREGADQHCTQNRMLPASCGDATWLDQRSGCFCWSLEELVRPLKPRIAGEQYEIPSWCLGDCGLSCSWRMGAVCARGQTSSDDLHRPNHDLRSDNLPHRVS